MGIRIKPLRYTGIWCLVAWTFTHHQGLVIKSSAIVIHFILYTNRVMRLKCIFCYIYFLFYFYLISLSNKENGKIFEFSSNFPISLSKLVNDYTIVHILSVCLLKYRAKYMCLIRLFTIYFWYIHGVHWDCLISVILIC